ncbi:hypothetical protein SEA_NANCIA_35 [Arthrobacter phage Nancia]|uniref:Uncharacterized protein n=11 Tax=Korravirus drrobert TaxID=1982078 RepID=A0A222ZG38_9CAUD|nr:hypothetical protein FDH56_gp34 [Arthrobacter phage DrRobert]AOQ28309.1 hypothetical protein SEA_LUCY_35 [Arthrobacter phage Lucy]ASR83418.1 hypothetical protein SEA_CHRISTIAN_35 [Arthrobacter phage Christian]ASR83829.1 hypothetical protein SEA_PITADOG_35 [Arthrobacter phage PitaDog]AZF98291.1 hypothetical protein SEA_BODACIOUS_35 [Arthrobacter phage Bodacious]AZS07018.1 hypothetical protein SEA_CHEWCHEW_35 [Arthrobacter phage ChewChew]AZS08531.1 hypothetical protein SEA_LASAGNA_34 [Arthro
MTTTVDVQYPENGHASRSYAFKTQLVLEPGDLVLVRDRSGVHITLVTAFPSETPQKATRWAFQRVDMDALDRCERRDKVLEQIKAKVAERQTLDLAYTLAEQDPEMMKLVKELEA